MYSFHKINYHFVLVGHMFSYAFISIDDNDSPQSHILFLKTVVWLKTYMLIVVARFVDYCQEECRNERSMHEHLHSYLPRFALVPCTNIDSF